MSASVKLPWRKALAWIFFSTLFISGAFGAGVLYWHYHKIERASDSRYTLVAIMQACDSHEPLQTNYLAELLGLSVDQSVNLYRFNTHEAVQRLLRCPLIKTAEVKKIFPGMIHVKYSLRKPGAYIVDYLNAAMDDEGNLIPTKPFYTPKNLPEIYLGLPAGLIAGGSVFSEKTALAQEVLKEADQINFLTPCRLRRIDVSKAFSKHLGEREIVLTFETCVSSSEKMESPVRLVSIIRFYPNNWRAQLIKYSILHERLVEEAFAAFSKVKGRYVIDMRISELAFIGEGH